MIDDKSEAPVMLTDANELGDLLESMLIAYARVVSAEFRNMFTEHLDHTEREV